MENQTKGDLFAQRKNWLSARAGISLEARRILKLDGRLKVCQEKGCSYDLHVDVCHIKDVADFPDSALVSEINDPSNLAYLCKNHHWELDHGHLTAARITSKVSPT